MARRAPAKSSARAKASASRPTPVPSRLSTPASSALSTPLSSAYPSAYPSDAEDEGNGHYVRIGAEELPLDRLALRDLAAEEKKKARAAKKAQKPFPFLSLPPELRLRIYGYHFADMPEVVDLDPDNKKLIHKKLGLLRTCKTVNEEAAHFFYSTNTFRLFPTHWGRFGKTKKPVLARLTRQNRQSVTTLELRVGPGWNNKPPRGWVVNTALGLADCYNVRTLKVFVEFDPGHPAFRGFRKSEGFFEIFCRNLLDDLLKSLPGHVSVEFDAFESILLSGDLMKGLIGVALSNGRRISFGPVRGWISLGQDDDVDAETAPGTDSMSAMNLLNTGAPLVMAVS